MTKRIKYALLLINLIFVSCCYKGSYSKAGYPRKQIKPFNEINVGVSGIDTLALYKSEIVYGRNSITKEYTYYEKEINCDYPIAAYMKFYPDNKLGLFLIQKTDTLNFNRNMFDPQNAKMGYYYIDGSKVFMKISTIAQCELTVIKTEGKITVDTILEENRNGGGNIFVKRNIPKEFLENWKPDW